MTDRPDTPDAERPLPAATAVIEAFGGIRPMAAKLDIPVTTVQGWKERDSIPKRRWAEIRQAAEGLGLDLDSAPQSAPEAPEVIAVAPDESAGTGESGPTGPTGKTPAAPAAPLDDTPWSASVPEDEIIEDKAAKTAPAQDAPRASAASSASSAASTSSSAASTSSSAIPPAAGRRTRKGLGAWPWIVLVLVVAGAAVTWDLWWPTVEKEADLAGLFSSAPEASDTAPAQTSPEPAATPQAPAGGSGSSEPAETAKPAGTDGSSLEAQIAALKDEVRGLKSGGGADDRIAALEKQVQALSGTLDTRVASLESRGATKAVESALAELRAENARLTEQITSLGKSVQALEQRLAEAEKRAGGEEVLMLAVGQLRAALARGAPFRQELSALEDLSAEDEDLAETIAPLWPYAAIGVETEADLRARFESLAPEVLSADQAASGGWTDRVLAKLNEVVTIRRVGGDVAGDGAGALLARAEARLAAGDLAGAVEILGGLKGPAAEAAAPWLADARARLAADKAVAALESRALAKRAPAGG